MVVINYYTFIITWPNQTKKLSLYAHTVIYTAIFHSFIKNKVKGCFGSLKITMAKVQIITSSKVWKI